MNLKYVTFTLSLLVATAFTVTHANAQENKIHYITDQVANFDTLISKFRNKVIYVDFWGTWCEPCRRELREKKTIADFEAYASKHDIVILYVCGDKDGNRWKSFINQNKLAGYHILLNPSLHNDVIAKFSFYENRAGKMKKGFYIPRHLIIDRDGMIADSMAADRNNPSLYAHLEAVLKSR